MVSEGVDIPRLRVGVYATTAKTPMIFRQIVGRTPRSSTDGSSGSRASDGCGISACKVTDDVWPVFVDTEATDPLRAEVREAPVTWDIETVGFTDWDWSATGRRRRAHPPMPKVGADITAGPVAPPVPRGWATCGGTSPPSR